MNLEQVSVLIFCLLIILLGLLAIWTTAAMIAIFFILTGTLILLQVYLVLVDPLSEEEY